MERGRDIDPMKVSYSYCNLELDLADSMVGFGGFFADLVVYKYRQPPWSDLADSMV